MGLETLGQRSGGLMLLGLKDKFGLGAARHGMAGQGVAWHGMGLLIGRQKVNTLKTLERKHIDRSEPIDELIRLSIKAEYTFDPNDNQSPHRYRYGPMLVNGRSRVEARMKLRAAIDRIADEQRF